MSRLAWSRLFSIYWRWSRVRYLLLHVDIRFMMFSCSYLGHSGNTVLIPNLKFENKNGRK